MNIAALGNQGRDDMRDSTKKTLAVYEEDIEELIAALEDALADIRLARIKGEKSC